MRKSAIAMLIALSFAAVSCGEPKITNAETTEEGVEVDSTAVGIEPTTSEIPSEGVEEVLTEEVN